jgi:ABC-type dipeptide/oligopeptide/nickel transport system permease subunit
VDVALRRQPARLSRLLAAARSKPLGSFGAIVVALMLIVALAAPFIVTHDPNRIDPLIRLQTPSSEHWLGTDHLGRDIFSRVVYGARVSAIVGPLAVALAVTIAFVIGAVSGFLGGKVDFVVQRFVDMFTAFPAILILLSAVQILTTSAVWPEYGPLDVSESIRRATYIVLTLGVILSFPMARVFRASALGLRNLQYMEAARSLGVSDARLVRRHLLPNLLPLAITVSTASLGQAILIEAAISYLGVGLPPDIPSWGLMLAEGRNYIATALNITIWPGLAIAATVFGFNVLGDALRDLLDPQLRGR